MPPPPPPVRAWLTYDLADRRLAARSDLCVPSVLVGRASDTLASRKEASEEALSKIQGQVHAAPGHHGSLFFVVVARLRLPRRPGGPLFNGPLKANFGCLYLFQIIIWPQCTPQEAMTVFDDAFAGSSIARCQNDANGPCAFRAPLIAPQTAEASILKRNEHNVLGNR